MRIDRILPYYVGLTILSLFSGMAYDTGAIVLRPFDAMVGFGAFVIAGAASRRGYARRLQKGLPYYLFAALYLYRGLSGLVMTGPILALKELIQGLEFLLLIHMVAKATKEEEDRMSFLQTLYVGFGVIAVGSALLHVLNGQYSGYKYLADFGYTTGGAPKYTFGLFGLMALVFWVGGRKNTYTLAVLVGAIVLCLLSGERKGWVALAAAAIAVYYVDSNFNLWGMLRNAFRARYLALAGLIVVGGVAATNYEYAGWQLGSLERSYEMVVGGGFDYVPVRPGQRQDVGRYNGIVFIIDALSRHPVFGVGTGGGKEAVEEFSAPVEDITTGHGEYQRYALENGLIGVLIYVFIWVSIIIFIRKTFKDQLDHISRLFIFGFVFYSIIVNAFIGGGAHNIMFLSLSIGFVMSTIKTK